ncbi:MAG: DUF3540 domain-containing protein [Planctomycetes bacterium]|nr:DUF3540 domain-containing protein [Planctomycetota bacterium]
MHSPTTSSPAPAADRLARAPAATTPDSTWLGPATVRDLRGSDLLVQPDDDTRRELLATPAFPFPYQPTIGDRLLVLGQEQRWFAVGVLQGARPATLTFAGDTDLRAVGGRLLLASDEAIELRAPRVTVRTGLLRTLADNVVEKAAQVRRWVRGLMAVRAGASRRVVDGLDSTRCQNSTTLAKDTVTIDGDQLHLGH